MRPTAPKPNTQSQPTEKLAGIVKRITFHSPDTGWTVLKITPFDRPSDEVPVIVHQAKVFAGATMAFYGHWTHHPKFGQQFQAQRLEELKPATANALEKYLGSGLIKGVGPAFAKRIVKHFGKDTLDVFDHDIRRLVEVPGIARKKLETIITAWDEHKDIKDVMIFLQQYGISTLFAVKIYKTYGKDAIPIVSNNPYQLAKDIYGIGFFSADKVALSLGYAVDSPERLRAAIAHALDASREQGHCFLTAAQITVQVNELLDNHFDKQIAPLLAELVRTRDVMLRPGGPGGPGEPALASPAEPRYYAPSIYYDEEAIAKRLTALAAAHPSADPIRIQTWITKYCAAHNLALSDEQAAAITGLAGCGFGVLTGGPGCGKTTTTRVLVGLLSAMGRPVLLAAPTGRATQRMTEVIGRPAKTLHRLLEWQPAIGGFKKTADNPLRAGALIIDECSMLDVHLAAAVLRATTNGTQVIFIGDADQLPSVGAGNVFRDIIASGAAPVFRLTKIFRQAEASTIIRFAHQINAGATPRIESPFHDPTVWRGGPDCLFIDADEATQEQLHFIRRVKAVLGPGGPTPANIPTAPDDPDNDPAIAETARLPINPYDNPLVIPDKFRHVDLDQLVNSQSAVAELSAVLKQIHPWSSLHYGRTATDMIRELYAHTIPKYAGPAAEIQVLTPMTKGSLGTANLNRLIQNTVNPAALGVAQLTLGDRIFRVGDRVIQRRNNYDLEVFNGDIGRITAADPEELKLSVTFPGGAAAEPKIVTYEPSALSELELAYAITIHKAQGSEFSAVIIPVATQHFAMLFRNLLYTGLTRAKQLAIFVGSRRALAMAVANNTMFQRQTSLQELLQAQDPASQGVSGG